MPGPGIPVCYIRVGHSIIGLPKHVTRINCVPKVYYLHSIYNAYMHIFN